MKLKIKRIDRELPLPEYKTGGAVAFDLYSREDKVIKPGKTELLPSNLIIEIPKGFFIMTASRSSTHKRGLLMANGVGIWDQDFHGAEDEWQVPLYNFSRQTVVVKRGERIAQAVLIPIHKANWQEITEAKKKSRGGFGSTGKK